MSRLSLPVPLALVVVLAITQGGCGSSKSAKEEEKKSKAEKPILDGKTINVGPGTGIYRSNDVKRETLWTTKWTSTEVEAKEAGNAVLQTVSGDIYREGKPVSHYIAERGRVIQGDQQLELVGNVRVDSTSPVGTLTCDHLFYDGKLKRIRAVGHVRVVSQEGTVGTLSELWATAKLDTVATPDLYPNP